MQRSCTQHLVVSGALVWRAPPGKWLRKPRGQAKPQKLVLKLAGTISHVSRPCQPFRLVRQVVTVKTCRVKHQGRCQSGGAAQNGGHRIQGCRGGKVRGLVWLKWMLTRLAEAVQTGLAFWHCRAWIIRHSFRVMSVSALVAAGRLDTAAMKTFLLRQSARRGKLSPFLPGSRPMQGNPGLTCTRPQQPIDA